MDVEGGPHGDLQPRDLILRAESLVKTGDRLFDIPALALPVVTKSQFICPPAHLDRLRELLPKVEKILVIGWRGSEKHFLKLLSEGLQKPVKVFSACGHPDDSTQTNQQMKDAGVPGMFFAAAGGFSDLVLSREGENFVRN